MANVFRAIMLAVTLAFLAMCGAITTGCAAGADARRAAAVQTLNTVAAAADVAGDTVVQGYCQAQGRALNRPLEFIAGHCLPASSQEPRPATPDEVQAVGRVREVWRPVLRAHGRVADAHEAAAALVRAEAEPSMAAVLNALGAIFRAFPELVDAARGVGLTIPDIPQTPAVDTAEDVE